MCTTVCTRPVEVGFQFPFPNNRNQGKSCCKTSFQVGMDLKKAQKQGRNENMQEDYPYYRTMGEKRDKKTILHLLHIKKPNLHLLHMEQV